LVETVQVLPLFIFVLPIFKFSESSFKFFYERRQLLLEPLINFCYFLCSHLLWLG
jgi:hypothetical protein